MVADPTPGIGLGAMRYVPQSTLAIILLPLAGRIVTGEVKAG